MVAVEPDPGLDSHLRSVFEDFEVDIILAPLEEASLIEEGFDLAVAATSFHWVEQSAGLSKFKNALRPGGWVAIWWTVFGDPERRDPFNEVGGGALGRDPGRQASASHFQLDRETRQADLMQAGFTTVTGDRIQWDATLSADAIRALYASLINIRRLPEPTRSTTLEVIRNIAADQFGGSVTRPFVTALYTGRKASKA